MSTKRCECSNPIQDDETQCEWCEYPEPPMYVETGKYFTTLKYLGMGYNDHGRVELYKPDFEVTVIAPSTEAAERIFDDWVQKQEGYEE